MRHYDTKNKVYKFEAEGDTLYIEAPDEVEARSRFLSLIGDVPDELMTVTLTDIDDVPRGEGVI